jgi:hypothetical protein
VLSVSGDASPLGIFVAFVAQGDVAAAEVLEDLGLLLMRVLRLMRCV